MIVWNHGKSLASSVVNKLIVPGCIDGCCPLTSLLSQEINRVIHGGVAKPAKVETIVVLIVERAHVIAVIFLSVFNILTISVFKQILADWNHQATMLLSLNHVILTSSCFFGPCSSFNDTLIYFTLQESTFGPKLPHIIASSEETLLKKPLIRAFRRHLFTILFKFVYFTRSVGQPGCCYAIIFWYDKYFVIYLGMVSSHAVIYVYIELSL